MNARTRQSGQVRQPNRPSKFKVASLSHAIRSGLTLSMGLLALGGSGRALADDSCWTLAPSAASCAELLQSTAVRDTEPVEDLISVRSDHLPSTVLPSFGTTDAVTFANAGLTNLGDISSHVPDSQEVAEAMPPQVAGQYDITVVNNTDIYAADTGAADVIAWDLSALGNLTIYNQSAGTVTANAYDGIAIALSASAEGTLSITNAGAITATSVNNIAVAVLAAAYGDASFNNSGSVVATSTGYQAVGGLLSSDTGYATATNSGTISASGGQDQSTGFVVSGALGASMVNSGSITAISSDGSAIGIQGLSDSGTASVTNSSFIQSTSDSEYGVAIGAVAGSLYGQAEVINSGTVLAINYNGLAVGLQAYSAAGTTMSNAGYVLAGSYEGSATGLSATASDGDVTVSNEAAGYVRSVSLGEAGSTGIAISAISTYGDVSVSNDGTLLGQSFNGVGTGILARAGGTAYVSNTGYVFGRNALYGDARGIDARSTDGAVTVNNSGTVRAFSTPILGPIIPAPNKTRVIGILAQSTAGSSGPTAIATVVNSGTVDARGPWFVEAISAFSYGGVTITNTESGAIYANGLNAYGINAVASVNTTESYSLGDLSIDNAGRIVVTQKGDCYCSGIAPTGIGIGALSSFGGDIAITNSGSIGINTQHLAIGLVAQTYASAISLVNTGSITMYGSGTSGMTGIIAFARYADTYGDADGITIVNSGDLTMTTAPDLSLDNLTGGSALGIIGISRGGYGAIGRHGGDSVTILNTGHVTITSGGGVGIQAVSNYDIAMVINAGDVNLTNKFGGTAIFAVAGDEANNVPDSGAIVYNTGHVSVTGVLGTIGIHASVNTSGNTPTTVVDAFIDVSNAGSVFAGSQLDATGILARAYRNNPLIVDNSGSVYAKVDILDFEHGGYLGVAADRGKAVGIHVIDWAGDSEVINSGDIWAVTRQDNLTPGRAIGVLAASSSTDRYGPWSELGLFGYGNFTLTNTGSISASLISSDTAPGVPLPPNVVCCGGLGPRNTASGILSLATYGDVAIVNAGAISGSAQSDHYAGGGLYNGVTTANGIAVISSVGNYDYTAVYHYVYNPDTQTDERVYDGVAPTYSLGDITLINDAAGSVTAYSTSTDAVGTTALANGISALVTIGPYGGSLVSTGSGFTINNAGVVSATAMTANDPTGIAIANGISAINGSTDGFSTITNSGAVRATSTSPGSATAIGVWADAAVVNVALNAGSTVSATATGSSGNATGLLIDGGTITASNAGALQATFNGAGGLAQGASITSTGAANFTNSGIILATNFDDAIGVSLNSATATLLTNSGTIASASLAGESIAVQAGASTDTINNSGTISGQIFTNDGDDTLNNGVGGLWNSIGSSDFGSGNDAISNAGTLVLDSESIAMGDSDTFANTFTNSGTIAVFGDSAIDMGLQNNEALTNTGIIDFRDATPDDVLRITGDLGGSGQLGVDISVLNGGGDLLYVNGNVVIDSVTAVNANILDVPTTRTGSVAVVNVSGDSTAGNFVIGDVTFNPNHSFMQVTAVGMSSSIDASNARADVFLVDFDVSGLSDAGTLAAAFAPGVQSLMSSQIGTWRQRMGVIEKANNGLSVWARGFSDSGTVNPDNVANNFGQNGNFTFDQDNSGQEVGVDVGFSDQFSVGLLLGRARGKLTLNAADTGSSRLDGDTSGLYATWFSPTGFYVDASYRRMSFDANLNSVAGETRTSGDADAFNVEAGYGWTLGNGFIFEPQVQYTRTTVDEVDTLTGALAGFTPEGGSSSRARLGVAARKSFPSGNQIWTPYVALSAVREFDGENDFSVNGTFTGSTNTEGTSALVEGGLSWQVGQLAVFGGLNWQDGGALDSFTGGQVVVRYGW